MLWQVPITIATKKNAKAVQLVLSGESASVTVEGVGDGDLVLVSCGCGCVGVTGLVRGCGCGCVCAYVCTCVRICMFSFFIFNGKRDVQVCCITLFWFRSNSCHACECV